MRQLFAAIIVTAACAAAAAADFPSKPIRLVVHFPAGSSTDVIGRILAESAALKLGQPVIVDNKPGADGAIAAAEIKRSPADGYTLMLATNTPMSGIPALKKVPPYDVTKDFAPVTDVGRYTFAIYVPARSPANTLAELIAQAKSNPGKLAYGAGNVTGQLSMAFTALTSKVDMTYVPYRGEPPAMTDLIGGRIDVMVATVGVGMPHVRSGKLRALATITHKRSAMLPDVPTIREAGFPNFAMEPWVGLFGPANMPDDITDKLNRAFGEAMKDPEVIKKLASQEFALTPSTPEALGLLVKRQLEVHREIARAAGVHTE